MPTIRHLKDIDFTIVAEPNETGTVCKMKVYEIEGWTAEGVPLWHRVGSGRWPDPVETLAEADAYLDGSITFDGCSNWNVCSLPEMLIHFCGKDDATNLGKLFGAMYDLADELIAM